MLFSVAVLWNGVTLILFVIHEYCFTFAYLSVSDIMCELYIVDHNKHQARCTVCCKTFELSNMGRQSVTSPVKSVLHTKRCTSSVGNHVFSAFLSVSKSATVTSEWHDTTPESDNSKTPSAADSLTTVKPSFIRPIANIIHKQTVLRHWTLTLHKTRL